MGSELVAVPIFRPCMTFTPGLLGLECTETDASITYG